LCDSIEIALCTFSGKITGTWISGSIEWCNDYDTNMILKLCRKKYGIMGRIARFVSKSKGDLVVFLIIVS
jgi:hypothetical protein